MQFEQTGSNLRKSDCRRKQKPWQCWPDSPEYSKGSLCHNFFVSSFQRRPNCSQFKAVQQVWSSLSARLPTLAEVVEESFPSGALLRCLISSAHCLNLPRDPDNCEMFAMGQLKSAVTVSRTSNISIAMFSAEACNCISSKNVHSTSITRSLVSRAAMWQVLAFWEITLDNTSSAMFWRSDPY